MAKVRCLLQPASMAASLEHPEVLSPPEHPPTCCTQRTVTIAPSVNQKTAQRHDHPGPARRRSYARRSAAERANARIKDPATIDVARGWCRVMGLVPMTLWLATPWSCATWRSPTPSRHVKKRTAAGRPSDVRHGPVGAGGPPSATSSGHRPTHRRSRRHLHRNVPGSLQRAHRRGQPPETARQRAPRPHRPVSQPPGTMTSARNVNWASPKGEDLCGGEVFTFGLEQDRRQLTEHLPTP